MSELRVLHVDDEPDIRELVENPLSPSIRSCRSKSCASGADAIDAGEPLVARPHFDRRK